MKMFSYNECFGATWAFEETITKPLDSYAWPGGYPIYYTDGYGHENCPACANEFRESYMLSLLGLMCEWCLDPEEEYGYVNWADPKEGYYQDADINYEDPWLYCGNCNKRIESAYADDVHDSVDPKAKEWEYYE